MECQIIRTGAQDGGERAAAAATKVSRLESVPLSEEQARETAREPLRDQHGGKNHQAGDSEHVHGEEWSISD